MGEKGRIFELNQINNDLISHTANPVAKHIKDDLFRIYFSSRNSEKKSSIGHFDFDLKLGTVFPHSGTDLRHGQPGDFYQDGISIANIFQVEEQARMLFMGWRVNNVEHWYGEVGQIVFDKEKLTINPKQPILTLDQEEPNKSFLSLCNVRFGHL